MLPLGANVTLPLDPEGWSILEPFEDSTLIYVSSSEGDDSNTGLTPQDPLKTIDSGAQRLRNGYPDQLLLKRGDTWNGESLQAVRPYSGRSFDERIVVGAYGEGPRPLLIIDSKIYDLDGRNANNLAIVGLDFYAAVRDPASDLYPGHNNVSNFNGIRFVGTGKNILIEDCRFRYFPTPLSIDACCPLDGEDERIKNFAIRRCIVQYSWVPDSYSDTNNDGKVSINSGMYMSDVDGILIEECLFDQNGYIDSVPNAGPNMFNHNIYMQNTNSGTIVRGNIITRGAAHGIQMRSLGLSEDTFYARNSVSVNFTGNGTPTHEFSDAIGRYNVFSEGTRMDPNDGSWPRTSAVWAMELSFGQHAHWERNIITNRIDSGNNQAFYLNNGATADLIDNIVYKWSSTYDTTNPNWIDPERSLATYNATLGSDANFDDFITTAADRSSGEWDDAYSAYGINAYIREGFRETGANYIEAYPSSRSAHNSGGDYSFHVQSDVNWTLSESLDWLSVDTSGMSGDGTITVTVDPNFGQNAREGSITLSNGNLNRKLFIYQQADQNDPYIKLNKTGLSIDGGADSHAISIASNTDWTVTSTTPWITPTPGSGSGNGTFSIDVTANDTTGKRNGSFTIASGDANISQIIRVQQSAEDTWAGYTVDRITGWVDTDTLLGWLNVSTDPWVYSISLNTWIYLSEEAVENGNFWLLIYGVSFIQTPAIDDGFGSWNGFPLNDHNDVNIDERVGWLYTKKNPFLFSYQMGHWIYYSGNAGQSHAWVYFFK